MALPVPPKTWIVLIFQEEILEGQNVLAFYPGVVSPPGGEGSPLIMCCIFLGIKTMSAPPLQKPEVQSKSAEPKPPTSYLEEVS